MEVSYSNQFALPDGSRRTALIVVRPKPLEQIGWYKWYGGDGPPIDYQTKKPIRRVVLLFRSGYSEYCEFTENFEWNHTGWRNDIIAYKPIKGE